MVRQRSVAKISFFVVLFAASLVLGGCSKKQKKRALIGAVLGAGAGAGIGAAAGGGSGAGIGAAIGAVTGGAIGGSSTSK